jgi:hypothetical protein
MEITRNGEPSSNCRVKRRGAIFSPRVGLYIVERRETRRGVPSLRLVGRKT